MKCDFGARDCASVIILSSCLFFSVAGGALAAPKANQITVSSSYRDDLFGTYATYTHAFLGDMSAQGPLFRLNASVGVVDEGDGSRSLDVLGGYQFVVGTWRVRALAGVTLIDKGDDLESGLKLQGQAITSKRGEVYVNATMSYSAPDEQFQAGVQLGAPVGDLTMGPEASVLTMDEAVRLRAGLFLSGLRLGDVGLTVRTGLSGRNDESLDQASPYVGLSATLQY